MMVGLPLITMKRQLYSSKNIRKGMGCTSNPVMLYNLSQLVVTREDLEHLSRPFSTHGIDTAVKCMPANKAPGS
jgi:hypothetical protein